MKINSSTWAPNRAKSKRKKTSIGRGSNSRPLNKHKKKNFKTYKGQGK